MHTHRERVGGSTREVIYRSLDAGLRRRRRIYDEYARCVIYTYAVLRAEAQNYQGIRFRERGGARVGFENQILLQAV